MAKISAEAARAKVVIIGSGPAGYTAAIYAARAMLEPILIQGIQPGGQLTITTDVENYPGFADVIQGPWLMEQMQKQAEHVGTKIVFDHVNAVDLSNRPFRLTCDSGAAYLADALILATGAQARWLGLASEQAFKGYGVSACATATSKWWWWAAEIRRSRKRYFSRILLRMSRWCTVVMASAPNASCRSSYSRIQRSQWCGTRLWRGSSAVARFRTEFGLGSMARFCGCRALTVFGSVGGWSAIS